MQIKTFQAKDMAEALRLVKAEFGPEAMILNSKKIRKSGLLGFFEKPVFEVTALLDNRPRRQEYEPEPVKEVVPETNTMEEFQKSMLIPLVREIKELKSRVETLSRVDNEREQSNLSGSAVQNTDVLGGDDRPNVEELKRYLLRSTGLGQDDGGRGLGAGMGQQPGAASEQRKNLEDLKRILIRSLEERKLADKNSENKAVSSPTPLSGSESRPEAEELKRLLLRLGGKDTSREAGKALSKNDGSIVPSRPSEADELKQSFRHVAESGENNIMTGPADEAGSVSVQGNGDHFTALKKLLQNNGVENSGIKRLLADLARLEPETSEQTLHEHLKDAITAQIVCSKQISLNNSSPLVMAFVGPTGVGKTTTVAKIAGLTAKQRDRVAIITIDTYRIGAVEQLKSYAVIMGVPFAVASSPQELAAALEAYGDKQLILIDTGGVNPRDQQRLLELKSFLDVIPGIDTHLCLAASMRDKEQMLNFQKFAMLPISKLLITKMDESESFGFILNMQLMDKVPLSFLTSGQNVQDDVKLATPKKVAEMVLGEMKP